MNYLILSQVVSSIGIANGVIDRIELDGIGNLSVCTVTFYNGDEESEDQYQRIIFTKTDHPSQYILTPHKLINLSDYSFCSLKIFSGNLHPDDRILLFYTTQKAVENLS